MMERRHFLGRVASVAVGLGAAGLGASGCASMVPLTVIPTGRSVRLPLADHPELTRPGGSLRIRVGNEGRLVYLMALDGGGVSALSPVCTHQGCTVDVDGAYLVCPCHGSTYDREGAVIRGPATMPLTRFPAGRTAAGVLEVELDR